MYYAEAGVELNVHRTVTDVVAFAVNGKELLDVERTALNADLIKCADLL